MTTATVSQLMASIGEAANRTRALPIALFSPTQRCNSACVSCSWWNTPSRDELSLDEIAQLAGEFQRLRTRLVVFTGGEPLLRRDTFAAAELFAARGMTLHLLTSGLALASHADRIAPLFSRVIVSFDAADARQYKSIRGVDGFDIVCSGVRKLRSTAPQVGISARTTLHARNFRDMDTIAAAARRTGFDSISFLAADIRSEAFGHRDIGALVSLRLSQDDVNIFRAAMNEFIGRHADDIASGFIAESASKLRQLPEYFAALNGDSAFPEKHCNAPWVSSVIEANGDVRPCFFHKTIGNVRDTPLADIARTALPQFRRSLNVATDATCQRCVCSLKLGWKDRPWAS